jgi:RNA polymerase sigma factor (sigma-70 family)
MMQEGLALTGFPVTEEPENPTDWSEVRAAAAAAADELYTTHAPLLRYIALKRFHVPFEDAEGLVHDVFASYFSRSYPVHNPRAYLVGAICNTARHYWRERKNEEAALGNADLREPAAQQQLVDQLGVKLLLATTLSRLDPKCRDLIRRHYLNEETPGAIAESRQTTANVIYVLLHKCRKRAREIVRSLMVT